MPRCPRQLLINGARILSNSSIDIAPACLSPLMKKVGVESTLNFCVPRSRICWTLLSNAVSLMQASAESNGASVGSRKVEPDGPSAAYR